MSNAGCWEDVRVSVVMSVYNAESYLSRAVESVLAQDFENFEFVVVDDGSTDASRRILESYEDERLLVTHQTNRGLPAALNLGIRRARAPLIARMDADDIAMPNRLRLQLEFLDQNNDYVAVGSNARVIDREGRYIYTTDKPLDDESLRARLPDTPFTHPSSMFRKCAFEAAGGYCEKMMGAEDTVLFNRMAKFGKIGNLEEPLIEYRIVPTAISPRDGVSRKFARIVRKGIQDNKISDSEAAYLTNRVRNRRPRERMVNYHNFLAKKLLWNDYRPDEAREHLRESWGLKVTWQAVILYAVSFFPRGLLQKAYHRSKVIARSVKGV